MERYELRAGDGRQELLRSNLARVQATLQLLTSRIDEITASAGHADVDRLFAGNAVYEAWSAPARITLVRQVRFHANRRAAAALKRQERARLDMEGRQRDEQGGRDRIADGGNFLRRRRLDDADRAAGAEEPQDDGTPRNLARMAADEPPHAAAPAAAAAYDAVANAAPGVQGAEAPPAGDHDGRGGLPPPLDNGDDDDDHDADDRPNFMRRAFANRRAGDNYRLLRPYTALESPILAFCDMIDRPGDELSLVFCEWGDECVQAVLAERLAPAEAAVADMRFAEEGRGRGRGGWALRRASPADVPAEHRKLLFLDHIMAREREGGESRASALRREQEERTAEQAKADAAFASAIRERLSDGRLDDGTSWEAFRDWHLRLNAAAAAAGEGAAAGAEPEAEPDVAADVGAFADGDGDDDDDAAPFEFGIFSSRAAAEDAARLRALADRLAAFDFGPTVKEVYERVVSARMARAMMLRRPLPLGAAGNAGGGAGECPSSASSTVAVGDGGSAAGPPAANDAAQPLDTVIVRLAEFEQNVFSCACRLGDVAVVDQLLKDPDSLVRPSASNDLGLRLAVVHGHVGVLDRLLQDARVEPFGRTATLPNDVPRLAVKVGNIDVLRRLFEHPQAAAPAVLNAAFQEAAQLGSVPVLDFLLSGPVPSDVVVAKGGEALIGAMERGHVAAAERLLADPRVDPSLKGCYPLRAAAKRGYASIVRLWPMREWTPVSSPAMHCARQRSTGTWRSSRACSPTLE